MRDAPKQQFCVDVSRSFAAELSANDTLQALIGATESAGTKNTSTKLSKCATANSFFEDK